MGPQQNIGYSKLNIGNSELNIGYAELGVPLCRYKWLQSVGGWTARISFNTTLVHTSHQGPLHVQEKFFVPEQPPQGAREKPKLPRSFHRPWGDPRMLRMVTSWMNIIAMHWLPAGGDEQSLNYDPKTTSLALEAPTRIWPWGPAEINGFNGDVNDDLPNNHQNDQGWWYWSCYLIKGDCKITLEEEETKGGKGKGSLAVVGNLLFYWDFCGNFSFIEVWVLAAVGNLLFIFLET